MSEVQHISATILAAPSVVYDFVSNPANLPSWAAGVGTSGELVSGDWISDSPMGQVSIRFAPKNEFGVADHYVTLPNGQAVLNPMRVLPNGDGSEIVFTLFRADGVDDAAYEADATAIATDFATLKKLLE